MNIYIAHSTSFDFKKELYSPLLSDPVSDIHTLTFPHQRSSSEQFNSYQFFKNSCDLVVAEVSYASTGLGIELAWARQFNIPILCVYREDLKPSGALSVLDPIMASYSSVDKLGALILDAIETSLFA